jgi:hypothetical protein
MNVRMYRGAAAAAVVTLTLVGLLGCGSADQVDGAARAGRSESATSAVRKTGETSPAASTTRSATATTAAAGSDVRACFDGRCELAVSKPTGFAVDHRFGINRVSITRITADDVSMTATGPGVFLGAQTGPGGICTLNGLTIRVKSIKHGTAIVVISPNR